MIVRSVQRRALQFGVKCLEKKQHLDAGSGSGMTSFLPLGFGFWV